MSQTFQVGAGDKVKLYLALLPLGDRTEPVDSTITASSGITSGATSITVTALTGAIAGGTTLTFNNGTNNLDVMLSKDAKIGDTSLSVITTTAALTGSSTAMYKAKLRLLGGTQLSAEIGANRTSVLVFEDPLGYEDGAITSQSWMLPWTGNLLSTDQAFKRAFYASVNAISGREVYVWQTDPPPPGYTIGDGLKGACVVMNMKKALSSQSIITYTCEFHGQGSPVITNYSLT